MQRPKPADILIWLGLTACGSTMLLATTNQMCQHVAAVPFLWILPLTLYLLSFVICFDREAWYQRPVWSVVLAASVVGACVVLYDASLAGIKTQIAIYSAALFSCCMACHGELVRLKPHPRYLTLFYLMVSAGGALGGLFVALLAPLMFRGFLEYPIGLAGSCLLVLAARRWNAGGTRTPKRTRVRWLPIGAALLAGWLLINGLGSLLTRYAAPENQEIVELRRNFYGTLSLTRDDLHDPQQSRLTMSHGTTVHGSQYTADKRRGEPTMYYVPESGIGLVMQRHPVRTTSSQPLRVGVVGLGAGTIACYGRPGDSMDFYEINPTVVEMANRHFTYLDDAARRGTHVNVLLGDARIVMKRQLASGNPQQFDVLAVDAFSSEAIPTHLLTRECFGVYLRHLKRDGILAIHISNVYLDLRPVVRTLAEASGKRAVWISFQPSHEDRRQRPAIGPSDWVLITSNEPFLSDPVVQAAVTPWPAKTFKPLLWTDDFSNLFGVLR